MASNKIKKNIVTPSFRVSFPHVFKPQPGMNPGDPAKYSITMLFHKDIDITPLEKAVFAAAIETFGPKDKWPKNLRLPFKDGDEKSDMVGYKNTTYISASSKQKPGLVDKDLQPIIEDGTFYAGCFARATVRVGTYDKAGNKGVCFYLDNIQKLKDGEQFSGKKSADKDFESFADDSDDANNYESSDLDGLM